MFEMCELRCSGRHEVMAAFIFDDLGSLRLLLCAYLTNPLHRRVARSGASSISDVRGSQDGRVPCEEDDAKCWLPFCGRVDSTRDHSKAHRRGVDLQAAGGKSLLGQVRLI